MYVGESLDELLKQTEIDDLNIIETLNSIAKIVLHRKNYDIKTHGRDFLIHNFNDIGILLNGKNEVEKYCNLLRISTLQMTHFNGVFIDNTNTDQIEYEMRTIYATKFKCAKDYVQQHSNLNPFETLFNIRKNEKDEYDTRLKDNYSGMDKNITNQLINMRAVAKEYTARENHILHLEAITLKLYEKSIKRLFRTHLYDATSLDVIISEHQRIADIIIKDNMKQSSVRTLLSALNHYMRFFPNTKEKQEAREHYKKILSTYLMDYTLDLFIRENIKSKSGNNLSRETVFIRNHQNIAELITDRFSVNKVKQLWSAIKYYLKSVREMSLQDKEREQITNIEESYLDHFTQYFNEQRNKK